MVGHAGDALGVVIVHFVNFSLIDGTFFDLCHDGTGLQNVFFESPPKRGIVADGFCDYILRTLNCIIDGLDFFIYIFAGLGFEITACRKCKDPVGKRLQSGLYCDGCAGLFLLRIRAVQILDLREFVTAVHRNLYLICQLSLLRNQLQNIFFPLSKFQLVIVLLLNVQNLFLVETVSRFLAISGNKRYGVAILEKRESVVDLAYLNLKFCGNRTYDVFVHLAVLSFRYIKCAICFAN